MPDTLEYLEVFLTADADQYLKTLTAVETDSKTAAHVLEQELDAATKQVSAAFKMAAKTMSMTSREAEIYALASRGATDAQLAEVRAADKLITTLEQEQRAFEEWTRAEEHGAAVTKQMRNAEEQLADKQKELNRLLEGGHVSLSTYNRAMNAAEAETKKSASAWNRMALAMNPASTAITQVGQSISGLGRSLALVTTAPLIAFATLGIHEFSKFDNALTESYAIMGRQTEETKRRIEAVIKELSVMSKFSPDELAGGLKNLAAAGLTTEQSISSLDVVTGFATAGAFDLEKATQLLMDSQSALGMVEKDAVKNKENLIKVSDALVKAGDQSTASPQQFAEALANGAADAKNFGMTLQTTMAVLDAYASKGNKGAAAGSDLARATRLISKATRDNGEVFKKYNIEVIDKATGEYKNFIDIISDMERAFKGMTGPERAAALEMMGFEALAQGAILPLIGMSDQMRKWEEEQKSATDYTKNVAAVQLESFKNQMTMVWNEIKIAAMELGEAFIPAIRGAMAYVQDFVKWFRSLSDTTKVVIVGMAAVVASIGPILIIAGQAIALIGSVIAAVTALGIASQVAAVSLIALKFAAVGLAIGGIALLAVGIYSAMPAIRDFNAEIERAKKLNDELIDAETKRQRKILENANKLSGDDKQKRLQAELDMVNRNINTQAGSVRAAKAEVDRLNTTWKSMTGNKLLANAVNDLGEVEAQLKRTKKFAEQLKSELANSNTEEIKKAADAGAPATSEMSKKVLELKAQMEAQAATFGESGHAAQIYALKMAGANANEIASLELIQKKIVGMEAEKKHREELAKFDEDIKRMEAEAATFGLSSRAAAIYLMELEKANPAQIAAAKAADAKITALEKEKVIKEQLAAYTKDVDKMQAEVATYGQGARAADIYLMKLNGASAAQIAAAEAADAQLKSLDKEKKMMEDAAAVVKKYENPLKKMGEEKQKLKDMYDKGLISLEVYTNALQDAEKQMKKEYKVEFKVKGIESVEMGSAEAIARLEEFRAMAGGATAYTGARRNLSSAERAARRSSLAENADALQAGQDSRRSAYSDRLRAKMGTVKGFSLETAGGQSADPLEGMGSELEKQTDLAAINTQIMETIAKNTDPANSPTFTVRPAGF